MSVIISPSVLSADFGNLQRDLEMINESAADWFHIDIMDGVFVPNISFGFPVLKAIRRHAQKPLDVHAMIVDPDKYIDMFADFGTDMLTVHLEACTHLHRTLQRIQSLGMKAGVAINPHTPVSQLEDVMEMVDLVLLMSVNPGFGGQSFIPHTLKKVKQLKTLIQATQSKALIEVDGGVNQETGKQLIVAGADALVAGNYVFGSAAPMETIEQLKSLSDVV
jgi:ribulose-phosphate 3-epimerase